MLQRLKILSPLLVVIVFGVVCYLLSRELRHYTFTEIRDAVWQVSTNTLLLAAGLTVLSYLSLVGYDWLAVRAAGLSLPFWKIATASFLGHTTAYNFGAIFGGTSIRYRLYSTWGLKASEILRFVSMLMVNYTVGLLAMASVAFFLVSGHNTNGPAAIFAHLPNRLIGGCDCVHTRRLPGGKRCAAQAHSHWPLLNPVAGIKTGDRAGGGRFG